MVKRRYEDPNQMALCFCEQVETFISTTTAMAELAHEVFIPEPEPEMESEEELYVELAAACKAAIRESGLSREEVLGRVNRHFGRSGSPIGSGMTGQADKEDGSREGRPAGSPVDPRMTGTQSDPKRPLSINMFNNYLSKPGEIKLPVWVVYGISLATGSLRPFRALVAGLGGKVISANEETELLLGKLEQHIREGAAIKRQLQRELSGRGR